MENILITDAVIDDTLNTFVARYQELFEDHQGKRLEIPSNTTSVKIRHLLGRPVLAIELDNDSGIFYFGDEHEKHKVELKYFSEEYEVEARLFTNGRYINSYMFGIVSDLGLDNDFLIKLFPTALYRVLEREGKEINYDDSLLDEIAMFEWDGINGINY